MSFLQSFRLRSLLGLLLGFLLVISTETIIAESPIATELDHIRTANVAMEELATARLELETFNLERIRKLFEQGHASWLELKRQQVLVDSLAKQCDSLNNFQQFMEHLESQVDPDEQPLDTRTPVRMYLPGSVRLVGWIEPGNFAGDFESLQPVPVTRNGGNDELIAAAEERLRKAVTRCQDFDESTTAPVHWSQRAELQRNLAQADLNLLKVQNDFAPLSNVSREFPVASQPDSHRNMVTATDHADLLQASYRVAVAEANANGGLQVAEVDWRRQKRTTLAVEQLHSDGHATERELKKNRQLLKNALSRLEQERGRIEFLKHIRLLMEESNDFREFVLATEPEVELKTTCSWPAHILADAARIRYLIDLQRSCFDLDAQRASTLVKLEMQQEVQKKLAAAQARNAASKAHNQSSASLKDFRVVLAAGEQKQITSVQLKMESLKAQIQDLGEQISIMSLEEERFVLQCEVQERGNETMYVSTSRNTHSESASPSSYLELENIDEMYGYLNATCDWDPEYFSFSFDRRTTSPLIRSTRYPLSLSSTTPRFGSAYCPPGYRGQSRSLVRGFSSDLDYGNRSYRESRPCESRYRYGPWSYQSIYPFGMLRADLRSCLPPGYAPWYFPGYPTNLQPTNFQK